MSLQTDQLRRLGTLIANDRFATSFQSLGQYRSALLAEVVRCLEEAPAELTAGQSAGDLIERRCGRDA
ncbi:hypothetical protein [Pseudomonas quasicaspiana]|uniref:hypothetical protein n=1 Tax=Pseudomonas quasicaspiana TaxID=2829821 RepID=UPI001E3DB59B|nr:hypothetical protein [Pseudomonas quasicaspiana]MCD5980550.1 hypothetical protein [Pseudomonas quasicaspiana]